ncbi:uncharacterized protein V3H82_017172 [Fundulus diaphanus]
MDNPKEENRLVELMDDEAVRDEGFVEEEPEDLTVTVLFVPKHSSVQQASSPSSSAPSTSSQGDLRQRLSQSPLPPPVPSSLQLSVQPLLPSLQPPPVQRPADPPLPPLLQRPVQPTGASGPAASAGSSADQAPAAVLGPDGIPGWDKVQDLAEYLVSLRQALYLDEQQVTEVIRLWTALPEGDKRRIHYQPRHQPKLAHGRFKAPKNTGVTPGVDSVKRSLIGAQRLGPSFS